MMQFALYKNNIFYTFDSLKNAVYSTFNDTYSSQILLIWNLLNELQDMINKIDSDSGTICFKVKKFLNYSRFKKR
jgi:hypothetical protein